MDESDDILAQRLANGPVISLIEKFRIFLIQALIFYKRNDLEKALFKIKKALEIGRVENLVKIFIIRHSEIENLLKLVFMKKIYPEFTEKVLNHLRNQSSQVKIPQEDELLEPFSDRELQILSLLNSLYSTP